MKIFFVLTILIFNFSDLRAGNWCKAIYHVDIEEGELNRQISKCKNSDNFFLAIHTTYKNSGHLINSLIAQYCDIRRQIIKTNPREGDPFFTVVCEFRKNKIRK